MNCPKCNLLLFKEDNSYYSCIGCALSGTIDEMRVKAVLIKKMVDASRTKVACRVCNNYVFLSDIATTNYKSRKMFVCNNCFNVKKSNIV